MCNVAVTCKLPMGGNLAGNGYGEAGWVTRGGVMMG